MSKDALYFPTLSFDPRSREQLAKEVPWLIGPVPNIFERADGSSTKRKARIRDAKALPAFRQTDITRAIKAVRKAGLGVARTEIDRDGTIRIVHGVEAPTEAQAFDDWHAGRHAGAP